ncbi:MAG: DUF1015 domain-containing protein [Candidatus Rokubacteria bacterium]|nr:DUF1015 domain-containing protein [Candidatus Rokubacteria bacterium]
MKIEPLRGYRYHVASGRDVAALVAPPYDQIGPEIHERLLQMSPHNVVRLTLPREEPGRDRYQQANAALGHWLADGVFAREERPTIYPYHQTYKIGGKTVTRRGFVALGEVSGYAAGVVRPHERTHAGPKQDRRRLLEATGADIGLLFMLVSEPTGELLRLVTAADEPVAEACDLRGEEHRLWRIADEATIARVRALMAPKPVIIADGHHRYETAVEYAAWHPEARWKLMNFCTLEAPGLTILPNHRLVHDVEGFALDQLARAARAWFDVAPLTDPLGFRPGNRSIGVVAGREAMVFRLRDDGFRTITWPSRSSRPWRELAVSILHEGLLKPLLDITDEKLDAKTHVDYVADQGEAITLARQGRYQVAFLIAPTTSEELQAVVEQGELLPQKSTHFYPKLLDGLVFHRLGES